MKIQFDKFLDIYFSIMNDSEIYAVNIMDIMEVIKIIYSSDDYKLLASRLNINSYTDEDLEKHRFTKKIDENNIIHFEVDKKEINKILEENKVDAGFIQNAINKRELVKYFALKYNGLVDFKYDSPSGLYNLAKINMPNYVTDSKIFTDGNITQNILSKNDANPTTNRTVKIDDATFSLFTYYVNDSLNKIELRGSFEGDYYILFNETNRLISGLDESFDVVINDSPKVYKLKRH